MALDFRTVTGKIKTLGNAIVTTQAKNYTLIEIECDDGQNIELFNTAISTTLDNYLTLDSKVELKMVSTSTFGISGGSFYIYGIKPEGKNIKGFIPATFSTKRNVNIFAGALCIAGVWTIPLGIYLFWKAFVKTKAINRIKDDINN